MTDTSAIRRARLYVVHEQAGVVITGFRRLAPALAWCWFWAAAARAGAVAVVPTPFVPADPGDDTQAPAGRRRLFPRPHPTAPLAMNDS